MGSNMDMARERKIAELCREAIELPPHQRTAWLKAETASDPELLAEVEAYLTLMAQSNSDPFSPLAAALPQVMDWSEEAMVGQIVGSYRILAKLGEGGMGCVFLAEQTTPISRKVALKIIKKKRPPERQFKVSAEAQALALLTHPNITTVFEVGFTKSGHLFFAMEHVAGLPLMAFCAKNELHLDQRLLLFQKICDAINHAHQEHILHRDLKPSNILVSFIGGQAVPKIIDFGTVTALDRPEFEDLSILEGAGTPLYMSPEMFQPSKGFSWDAQADIYALGIIFFELVFGETPILWTSERLSQIIEKVTTTNFPKGSEHFASRPSGQQNEMARNLQISTDEFRLFLKTQFDEVFARATAQSPANRYQTMAEFTRDIHQLVASRTVHTSGLKTAKRDMYLDGKPVLFFALLIAVIVFGWHRYLAYEKLQSAYQQTQALLQFVTNQAPFQDNQAALKHQLNQRLVKLEDTFPDNPILKSDVLAIWGRDLFKRSHFEEAKPLLEKSLELKQGFLEAGSLELFESQCLLAEVELATGAAEKAVGRLSSLPQSQLAQKPLLLERWASLQAEALGLLGQPLQQQQLLEETLVLFERRPQTNEASVYRLQLALGKAALMAGDFQKAVNQFENLYPRVRASNANAFFETELGLARAYLNLGQGETARSLWGLMVDRNQHQSEIQAGEPWEIYLFQGSLALELQQDQMAYEALRQLHDPAVFETLNRQQQQQIQGFAVEVFLRLAMPDRAQQVLDQLATGLDFMKTSPLQKATFFRLHARMQDAYACPTAKITWLEKELEVLDQYFPLHPDRLAAMIGLFQAHEKRREPEKAVHYLKRAQLLAKHASFDQHPAYKLLRELQQATK